MIVCDVCKRKVIASEVEIQFKGTLLQQGFPIKFHLCHGHQTQFVEAVKLVASIFRSIDCEQSDERCQEWTNRMIPWTFDENGQRTS